ncbi:anthocyanidin 3-O-glucosyltransferase 5 [Arachis hypogaea]|uniref:Glycosyltransferase n=1 Tax=Arachis hypogaea TaxID=3818 RepID=A0A444Z9T1_ARAHY|nr:anthocyanidin 3-O-glucosyltransferase 5 [Arachis hypogaea]QHO10645.1 Anthocyanidin 3-O-glucosyltransferase [Arachis hypogaea]RYR10937.1 hypothetical protein Ahy_B05g079421 [Arachis hypogaea]
MENQQHMVLLSSPGLGHLIPIIELGKRFVFHHNLKITIIAFTSHTSHAEKRVLKTATSGGFIDIVEIPPPDISSVIDPDAAIVTRLCVMMREGVPAIRDALSKLAGTATVRPSTLIIDIFGMEALGVAEELKMRKYVFVASHAWFLSLLIYAPTLDKQVQGQYADQKEPFQIPGCTPLRPEDVVDTMLDRNDKQYQEHLGFCNGIPKGDGVLVNTWETLQQKELESLRNRNLLGGILKAPVYAVGPLVRLPDSEMSQGIEWLTHWLDGQREESVIYVSFGSGGTMSCEQMTELAWGLELSGQRFIWVLRAPIDAADAAFFTTGSDGRDEDGSKLSKYLPEGFSSRTYNVGVLVSQWGPQVDILRHPSVGGFLSHCGWNSALESITNGVPMVAWPLYAEQRMNATLLVEELGVAVRPRVLPTKKVVDRDEIASMVREIMVVEEDCNKVKKKNPIRERVKAIERSAVEALSKGGALAQVVARSE